MNTKLIIIASIALILVSFGISGLIKGGDFYSRPLGFSLQECSKDSQCSQECGTKCPKNVDGCCIGCNMGLCVSGTCVCKLWSYCSGDPAYQMGEKCVFPYKYK
jgi:hypothetical protein